jgi:hypothetical protein
VGKKLTIETLINKEALFLVKYLRNERKEWIPRIRQLAIYKKKGGGYEIFL